jgi:uncharacterized protein DUF6790
VRHFFGEIGEKQPAPARGRNAPECFRQNSPHYRSSPLSPTSFYRGIAGMIALIVVLLSVLLPLAHLALSKAPRTRQRVIRVLLLYALVLDVGVIGLPLGFIPHVFFADATARLIGWQPGSPFSVRGRSS